MAQPKHLFQPPGFLCEKVCTLWLCIIIFTACSSKEVTVNNEKAVTFNRFPEEQRLAAVDLVSLPQVKADGLLLYNDSVLLIRNAVNSSPHHFSLLDLGSRKITAGHLEAGRKPGQSMSFLSYGLFSHYLWVYDIVKDKIIISSIDSTRQNNTNINHELAMPAFYYAVQVANDKIVATGRYDSPYKIFILGLPGLNTEKQFLPYSPDTLTPYPQTKKTAYESFLFLKPKGDKCVLACRYADQVEITDLATQRSKIIKGPEIYEPDVVIMKNNDGKELSTRGPDTRYAFVKGKVTDKFIYLLYSGNNHQTEHLYYGKYIYVYDWQGNPVKKLELENEILDMAVTRNDSLLYIYEPATKSVKTAKL